MPEHEVAHVPRTCSVGPDVGLAIETDHLLVVRDDARLLRRRAHPRHDDTPRVGPPRAQRRDEAVARRVTADDAAHRCPPSEGRDVAHHVAGAARSQVLVRHLDHWHRRLGRDAAHGAPDELVEHQVADDEGSNASEPPDELDEPPLADALHGSPR